MKFYIRQHEFVDDNCYDFDLQVNLALGRLSDVSNEVIN